jgi:trans-aconitate methyltransferase
MNIWIWIFLILAGSLFVLKMTYVLCTALALPATQGALYVSTTKTRIAAFIEAVPMKKGQILVDLGCGDGRVLRRASKNYKVKAIGFEINLLPYIKAQVLSAGLKHVEIRRKNFWSQNLSIADVVFCYLNPDVMRKLSTKLKAELKPGTMVVSCNFALPGFKSVRVMRPEGTLHNDPLYIYQA